MFFYRENNCWVVCNSKAQGAVEFVVLFGAVMFFFIMFFSIVQMNISDKNKEKEQIIVQNVALNVQDEISLASGSTDGYSRSFSIPQEILGENYDITVANGYVNVSLKKFVVFYKVAEVQGSIQKGNNFIKKENGAVYLNQ